MAVIGIIVALIGAAVGTVVGLVGGLVGVVVGLLGASVVLLTHFFPVVLITLGIIWLVKASTPKNSAGVMTNRTDAAAPPAPCKPTVS